MWQVFQSGPNFRFLKIYISFINEIKYYCNFKWQNKFYYGVYIEIYPWFLSFTFIFFQIILNNISFMKIKILKPKFKLKINGLHFVDVIQNIPLVVNEKVSQSGYHSVLSPNCWNLKLEGRFVVHLGIMF